MRRQRAFAELDQDGEGLWPVSHCWSELHQRGPARIAHDCAAFESEYSGELVCTSQSPWDCQRRSSGMTALSVSGGQILCGTRGFRIVSPLRRLRRVTRVVYTRHLCCREHAGGQMVGRFFFKRRNDEIRCKDVDRHGCLACRSCTRTRRGSFAQGLPLGSPSPPRLPVGEVTGGAFSSRSVGNVCVGSHRACNESCTIARSRSTM